MAEQARAKAKAARTWSWGEDAVDTELDRLIEKRHDPADGEMLLEPGYAESVRRYNARQHLQSRYECLPAVSAALRVTFR
jgi:hypothetical protein